MELTRSKEWRRKTIMIIYPSKWNMRDSWGRRGLVETPECVKDEGRLKPPFAGNVDIPLAGARRLIIRPRKARVFHLRWPERKFLDILIDRKSTRLNSSNVSIS